MANEEKKEEKKIIIDEDWKHQAQKEKEVMAAQEKAEEKKPSGAKAKHGPLPKGDLAALISLLVTQTLFALGLLRIEGQEDKEPDLEMARYNIDILQMLQEKTKGNLTEEEQNVLDTTLNEVRMAYVKVAGV